MEWLIFRSIDYGLEITKVIIELLKVIVWPLVILTVLSRFQPEIKAFILKLADKNRGRIPPEM
ncbi:MAG: hypothetical protein KA035_00015 [Candidatus Levybacteria bacterium]|nr:hypothetical protein [Candidatus Levybacteria bacterium]